MAYSDTRGLSRLSPASVAATLAINSLMLAGFVMLKPDVLPWSPPKIIELIPMAPKPAKPVERQQTKEPRKGEAALVTQPRNPALPQKEDDFVITKGDELGQLGGTSVDDIIDPIKITEPVFRTARFDPRYSGAMQPHYPPGLVRAEIEGSATIRVLVGADGRVKAVEPVRASHPDFLEATRKQALAKWRFIPATRDGEAVESWREMTVTFVMPD